MKDWTKWDKSIVKNAHGNVYYYRSLYSGDHAKLFPRAVNLAKNGEVVSELVQLEQGLTNKGSGVPYIVANVSKLIPEIPAMLVSRSIGRAYPANDIKYDESTQKLQTEVLLEIEEDSNLVFEHYTNILQHQIDGGLVGIVTKEIDDVPIIEMKARDVYFPHDDGRGADIAIEELLSIDEDSKPEKYLHVYRERIERSKERDPVTKKRKSDLRITHMLFKIDSGGTLSELDKEDVEKMLGLEEAETLYEDRSRGFIEYWANAKTFDYPLGISALHGQESKQEEINWTLTRNAIVFERNGKPRIAVNKSIMKALQDKAFDRTGDDTLIDARDLEIVEMDDTGKSLSVIQIDIAKIGNMEWVKDLMKIMFVETQTSEKAVDFYLDGAATGAAQSGIAKFYDLFTSIIKAEKLAKEYVVFLQNLFQSALWMERELGDLPELPVDKPDIHTKGMIPISRKELLEQESLAYEKKVQSLYETVKRIKPDDSESSIDEEVETIESASVSDDSTSLVKGRSDLSSMLDNRDKPLVKDNEEGA